jgi:predicted amidohydrolase
MHGFGRPEQPLAAVAEPLDGPFVTGLLDAARDAGVTVVAGMFEAVPADPTRAYNTVVAVGPDGLIGRYRKLHLFDALGWHESNRLAVAAVDDDALLVFAQDGFTVGVLTCYDLRFPELTRALVDRGVNVFAVPAAWVAGPLKEEQWRVLIRARAIENTSYLAAADQPGPEYAGRSAILDPTGVEVAALPDGEGLAVADLLPQRVLEVRERMPSLLHRRFQVRPS